MLCGQGIAIQVTLTHCFGRILSICVVMVIRDWKYRGIHPTLYMCMGFIYLKVSNTRIGLESSCRVTRSRLDVDTHVYMYSCIHLQCLWSTIPLRWCGVYSAPNELCSILYCMHTEWRTYARISLELSAAYQRARPSPVTCCCRIPGPGSTQNASWKRLAWWLIATANSTEWDRCWLC